MKSQQQVDEYLLHLESYLRSASKAERNDILQEIGAHIRDSIEQQDGGIAGVLNRLGEPDALAKQYLDSVLLQKATRSISPVLLLRAALRLATKGIFGIIVLVCGVFGYAFGAGSVLVGLIKPFAPAHTGWWVQNGVMVSSGALVVVPPPPAHEILGWWIIPIALILGSTVLCATTFSIRLSLRLSRSWQARLGGTAGGPHLQLPRSGCPMSRF